MALLSVKERQTYLSTLGFYKGRVDGLEGVKTAEAYKSLQLKYFNLKYVDGKYGTGTDNLLRSVYACRNSKYFAVTEFKCKCGGSFCNGYPAALDQDLINGLNDLRVRVGGSLQISSGLRCKTWNTKCGGASSSRHMLGKAADVKGTPTSTKAKRIDVKIKWMTEKNARYTYCQEDTTKYKMGTAVHVDVK